jgi:hypothetical protein
MSVALAMLIAAAACCIILLGIMLGFDFLSYRRGRGGMLSIGVFSLIFSGTQFYTAWHASSRHLTVSHLYWGAPVTPAQDYAVSVLLLLFGATCIVLSLRRAERNHDAPNV